MAKSRASLEDTSASLEQTREQLKTSENGEWISHSSTDGLKLLDSNHCTIFGVSTNLVSDLFITSSIKIFLLFIILFSYGFWYFQSFDIAIRTYQ